MRTAHPNVSVRVKTTCQRFRWESEAPAELGFGAAEPLPPGKDNPADRLMCESLQIVQRSPHCSESFI